MKVFTTAWKYQKQNTKIRRRKRQSESRFQTKTKETHKIQKDGTKTGEVD